MSARFTNHRSHTLAAYYTRLALFDTGCLPSRIELKKTEAYYQKRPGPVTPLRELCKVLHCPHNSARDLIHQLEVPNDGVWKINKR